MTLTGTTDNEALRELRDNIKDLNISTKKSSCIMLWLTVVLVALTIILVILTVILIHRG